MNSSDRQNFHKEKTEIFELAEKWSEQLKKEEEQSKKDQQGPFVSSDYETNGEDIYWAMVRDKNWEVPISLVETKPKAEVVTEASEEVSFDSRDKDSDPKNDGRVYSEEDLLELQKLALEKTEIENMLARLDAEGSDLSSIRGKLDSMWKEYDELSTRLSGGKKQPK